MSPPSAQISPGPLSRAHADLDTAVGCLQCHGTGDRNLTTHCLDCHREIVATIRSGSGFHGQNGRDECASCHPEHGGRDFELIEWPAGSSDRFDHRQAAWPLLGKHAEVECRKCHRPENHVAAEMKDVKRRDPSRTWLGLGVECASCHEDVHRGALGVTCQQCHTPSAWKPVQGFDHARSEFPLTGKHVEVECAKCHLVPGKVEVRLKDGSRAPLYKPVPHAECSDCHKDVHAGALGPLCASCHVTTAFTVVDRSKFDHERTRYPLRGAHVRVECASCHDIERAWGKKPPYATCAGCHRDVHDGRATLRDAVVDCASCHVVESFRPSTYTATMHADSSYPLTGKHLAVECAKCHPKDATTSRVDIRPASKLCRDCHDDAHNRQLVAEIDASECGGCHVVDGFTPSTYDVARHAETRLPLEGRHAAVECKVCHGPDRTDRLPPLPPESELGPARVALRLLDPACESCHADPHQGRFGVTGKKPREGGCISCHDAGGFRPSRVDTLLHATLDFPLEGGHRTVPCIACHTALAANPSGSALLRAGVPPMTLARDHERCRDCHEDPHAAQFADRPAGDACNACHVVQGWRPASRFDHDRDSDFRLDKAHRDVACEKCHRPASGEEVLRYDAAPDRCENCHGKGGTS